MNKVLKPFLYFLNSNTGIECIEHVLYTYIIQTLSCDIGF